MSNIEDDVKILKEFAETCKRGISVYNPQEAGEALEHILAEREQKDKRIQELEEENRIFVLEGSKVRLEQYIKENFIPKQVVIDLKNSITLDNTIVGGRRNGKILEYGIKLGKIKALQELLEREK